MKKIKSIQQLRDEKRRIQQRQQELEWKIKHRWNGLKESLQPVNLAGDLLGSMMKSKLTSVLAGDHLLKNTFTYGLSLLAGKLAGKAGEKIESLMKKN